MEYFRKLLSVEFNEKLESAIQKTLYDSDADDDSAAFYSWVKEVSSIIIDDNEDFIKSSLGEAFQEAIILEEGDCLGWQERA